MQVFGVLELVRRFGRWTSGTFHLHLWESREQDKAVARGMAGGRYTLKAAHGLGAPAMRKGVSFAA